jgi:hypothetical protein
VARELILIVMRARVLRAAGPLPELLGPEKPQDDTLVVHDHTRIPSRRRAFTDRAYRLLQSARRDGAASDVSRSSTRGVSPF